MDAEKMRRAKDDAGRERQRAELARQGTKFWFLARLGLAVSIEDVLHTIASSESSNASPEIVWLFGFRDLLGNCFVLRAAPCPVSTIADQN